MYEDVEPTEDEFGKMGQFFEFTGVRLRRSRNIGKGVFVSRQDIEHLMQKEPVFFDDYLNVNASYGKKAEVSDVKLEVKPKQVPSIKKNGIVHLLSFRVDAIALEYLNIRVRMLFSFF